MSRTIRLIAVALTLGLATAAEAQITAPRVLSASPDRFATLEEQLTNRLRATSDEQRAYIRFVVEQCKQERLDTKLVVAVERYAIRRNRYFPFPFFERAMRFEAAKRRVTLPPVQQFASTKSKFK